MRSSGGSVVRACALFAAGLLLAPPRAAGTGSAHPGAIAVVASTEVWGSVRAPSPASHAVNSIITGAGADPHSFQATPADAAAIADASLVVYNGGGYDPWVDQVLASHRGVRTGRCLLLLGAGQRHLRKMPPDEHVFYDLGVAKAVAAGSPTSWPTTTRQLPPTIKRTRPSSAATSTPIAKTENAIADQHPDAAVVATEPVVHYLLVAAGLTDRTHGVRRGQRGPHRPRPGRPGRRAGSDQPSSVAALVFNAQTATAATTPAGGRP